MTNNILLTILLFLNSLIGFAQTLSKVKTNKHQQISGTNISLVPPSSFEPSENFKGFQNPEDPSSMLMVVEIPAPYSEIERGFNADMLQTKGMELRGKKDISIANFKGLLLELDQFANGTEFSKHILIYGNEKATTIINGVFLKDSVLLGDRIKQSVLTTVVDFNFIADPRGALHYDVNEDAGSLKFNIVMGNGMLFNRDLKIPTESSDKASLLTGTSFSNAEIKNEKLFCISRIKKYPDDFSLIPSKLINAIEIDGLKGYELFAKNNDKTAEEMYQVILFDQKGGYYLFVGTYIAGSEDAVRDIKSVIHTFKRKE